MKKLNLLLLLVVSYVLLLISVQLRLIHPNWFSVGFGFVSLVCLLNFIHFIPEVITSARWPAVEGEIITSEARKASRTTRNPLVVYAYNIDGIDYQSERIKVGAQDVSSTSDSWTQGTLDKYPLGKRVTVYFNPNSPAKAVLEPGMNLRILTFSGLALIFFVVSWIFGFLFMRI